MAKKSQTKFKHLLRIQRLAWGEQKSQPRETGARKIFLGAKQKVYQKWSSENIFTTPPLGSNVMLFLKLVAAYE